MPSASKIEAGILSKFEPNLDHLGGEMRKGIQIKTIRNLNLDHPGGKCQILTIRGGLASSFPSIPPRMVKIWHFPPGWSRFRFLMVLIWIPFLISPPDGQDLAQICSKCRLQFLRLMATPWTALSFSGEASRIYRILHSCFYVLELQ